MPKHEAKARNPDNNPCLEESNASHKCLDANNYDKKMCALYFQKYTNCRKYWHNIMIERRQQGVKPPMPTAEERREILAAVGGPPY